MLSYIRKKLYICNKDLFNHSYENNDNYIDTIKMKQKRKHGKAFC